MRALGALPCLGFVLALHCGSPQHVEPSSEPPVSPAPSPRPSDDEMRPPSEAPRDLSVIELRNDASRLVTIRALFASGSADDPAGQEGVTRLVANLMTEGGTERLTYEQLTRALFPMAAHIDFAVDRDMTVFVGQVHRDHLAEFYPIFRDVLLHPRLADEDFRRIRAQTLSALTLELRGNDDEALGREFLQSLIYAAHPYGHPPLGTERGLGALTPDVARAWRPRVFCRDRVALGVAGGYPSEFAAQLRSDFDALPANCPPAAVLPAVERPHGTHVVLIDKPGASSTAVSLGFPTAITRRDPAFPALQFATNYLGLHRQSSGVLYQTLREARGLNYGDYAYAEYFQQQESTRFPEANVQRREQFVSLWIRPVPPRTAHFAVRAALRALTQLIDGGIPQDAFDRTRTFLSGYVSLFAQTESERLGYALDDAAEGMSTPLYPDRMRTAWASLDRDTASATAHGALTSKDLWIAIVAPNARELADAIAHDTPSPITYDSPKPPEVLREDLEIQQYALEVRPEDVRVVPLAEVFR